MVKIIITFLLLSFSITINYGQNYHAGFLLGGNSSFYSSNGQSQKNMTAYMFGLFSDFPINKNITICAEVDYIKKGGELQRGNTPYYAKPYIGFASIPLIGKIGIVANKFFIYSLLGPRVDIAISENDDGLSGFFNLRKSVNFGVISGAGFNITLANKNYFGFEFRYSPDLSGFPVTSYESNGIISYLDGNNFRNNSLELLMKVGIKL